MKDEMDILKEVGSTASAQGSTALSEMLGRKINLRTPQLSIVPYAKLNEMFNTEKMTMVMQTQILSGLKNQTLFIIFEEKSAYKIIDIFYRLSENIKKGSVFTELSMSLIKEVGNIVMSAYIGALGYFLRRVIIPSLPVLINAPFQEVLKIIESKAKGDENMMVIESVFEEPKEAIKGNFWLILTPGAAEEIKQACKKLLKEL